MTTTNDHEESIRFDSPSQSDSAVVETNVLADTEATANQRLRSLLPRREVALFSFGSPAWQLTLLVTVGCLVSRLFYEGTPNVAGVVFIGLCFALNTFAACWFCVARHWVRYPLFIAAATAVGVLFALSESSSKWFDWHLFVLPFAVALPVMITIETVKFYSGTFQKLATGSTREFSEGIQFNIRHLIALTTTVAIGCGIWNACRESIQEQLSKPGNKDLWMIILTIALTISTYTLFSIWAFLGHMRFYRPLVTAGVGAVAIYLGSSIAPSGVRSFWITMFLICWIALTLLLLLLRFEGYRFVKRP